MFKQLENLGYEDYLNKYPFHKSLNLDIEYYKKYNSVKLLSDKVKTELWAPVDPNYRIPYQPELDDLIRLHYLITSRRVTTVLEFGVGFSTFVLDHAIRNNQKLFQKHVNNNLRRENAFEVHSIDNSKKWIKQIKNQLKFYNTSFYYEKCRMGIFNDRICTFYDNLPNICPDLIYLDAPHQFSVLGKVRGISTRHPDRVPMAADILSIEHFLLPGTLIVVDGRTANARFLKANLQRNWKCTSNYNFDQHFFELMEEPLGYINSRQLSFSRKR